MTNLSEDPTYLVGGALAAGWGLCGRAQRHSARQIPDSRRHASSGWHSLSWRSSGSGSPTTNGSSTWCTTCGGPCCNSDVEGVLSHMAPNVQYLQGDTALLEDATRALIRTNLSHAQFDFVRISDLQTSAGQQSRRGKAEFRVFTRGRSVDSAGHARRSDDVVAGFSGDRAGRLEGEPDQSDHDAPGNLGSSWRITADRRLASRPQRRNWLPPPRGRGRGLQMQRRQEWQWWLLQARPGSRLTANNLQQLDS